jgi:hypothetical protein
MARGRKPKIKTEETIVPVVVDHAKLLKQHEQEQQIQLEELYKDLAKLKDKVSYALRHVGMIDECDTIGEAAFKAGRVYGPLDEVNDKLEEMLEDLYGTNDFEHWDDIL